MQSRYYIGLDVHKKTISYCVKDGSGRIHAEGAIPATRFDLDHWMKTLPQPWTAAMEATIFTSWIYDHLLPHAAAVKVAHPLMLRAIAAAKKKNDRIDAHKIADCLRCDFLPECYMVSTEIRERRRKLRYRNLLVRQAVQMKNKIAVLLMEAGVSYNKQKLHKVGYFRELLATNQDIDDGLRSLLRLCSFVILRSVLVRPRHLFDQNFDHDYFFKLPFQRAGCRIKWTVFYFPPCPVLSCPACEPNSNDGEYSHPFRHIQYNRTPSFRPIATLAMLLCRHNPLHTRNPNVPKHPSEGRPKCF